MTVRNIRVFSSVDFFIASSLLCGLLSLSALTGCRNSKAASTTVVLPTIPIAHPLKREVTDYAEFTGQTDAKETVSIRPRVTGYLLPINFKDGVEVKEGDTLFEIDPRPYKAQLDEAISQVKINEASLNLARVTYERDKTVLGTTPGAISQQQLDQDAATVTEAEARLQSAKASTEVYKLNLDFTKVTAPITGMASRAFFTKGNLAIQDQTLLTTIVSLDPMYAYFNIDQPTLERIRQGINNGQIQRVKDRSEIPVDMALQNESNYPHRGTLSFVNNVFSASTGSVSARGEFENKKPANGVRLLMPGMFVRVRLPIGQAHDAILVIDQALASDQGLKYVYVIDPKTKTVDPKTNKVTAMVQYRRVQTGPLEPDGMRVILDGLTTDDLIVVGGLQQVQPRKMIEIVEGPMPTIAVSQPSDSPSSLPLPKASGIPLGSSQRTGKAKGTAPPAADTGITGGHK